MTPAQRLTQLTKSFVPEQDKTKTAYFTDCVLTAVNIVKTFNFNCAHIFTEFAIMNSLV